MERKILNAKEVADALGLSLPTTYNVMARADFPAIRLSTRRIVVPIDAFNRWLERKAENGQPV